MITLLILLPLAGAIAVGILPRNSARGIALLSSSVTFLLTLLIWNRFDASQGGMQLIEHHEWIPAIGAVYLVGVDGLSLLLILLTSLVLPFALLAAKVERPFYALMLVMQSALYGTFTAQNFVPWFLFYEMSLIPAFLLIKIWGGANRDRAAMKFFVYTFLGSVAILLSFLAIYLATGTFDFAQLAQMSVHGSLVDVLGEHFLGFHAPWLIFAGILFGFAVKVPLFPFHTWLPDAYTSAPTGVAMVLTGVLSKMGVYGFLRLLLPLFPHQTSMAAPWLLGLAVCSIVFASLAAWAQKDFKRMVAYLSINHLGYCMLALFAVASATAGAQVDVMAALAGVFMQIFSHGITAAALFYYVGLLEKRRAGSELADFGGLMQRAPLFCGWMALAMFSSLGLPGLNGFIGEFLIFKGSFMLAAIPSALATIGLLVTAVALLRAMQALFSGPVAEGCSTFPDLTTGEKWTIVPVSLLMLAVGIAPGFVLNIFNSTVMQMAHLFT